MLLSGKAPFGGDTDEEIIKNVRKHNYSMRGSTWRKISADAKDFVKRCLEPDASKRITAKEALEHPWITKEEQEHEPHRLDSNMISNLRKFAKYGELKRVAMEAVAFSLDHEEIKELTQVFEDMDTDHNGFVGLGELKTALKRQRKSITDAEVSQIFNALDEDHAGRIGVNEFVAAALEEKYHQDEHFLHQAFHNLDRHDTGFITISDLKELLGNNLTEARAEQMLTEAEMHEHPDEHKVSYAEFLKFMRNDGETKVRMHRSETDGSGQT